MVIEPLSIEIDRKGGREGGRERGCTRARRKDYERITVTRCSLSFWFIFGSFSGWFYCWIV